VAPEKRPSATAEWQGRQRGEKEAYAWIKETYKHAKKTYIHAKETYRHANKTYIHAKETYRKNGHLRLENSKGAKEAQHRRHLLQKRQDVRASNEPSYFAL
jgi:hypothetical protein